MGQNYFKIARLPQRQSIRHHFYNHIEYEHEKIFRINDTLKYQIIIQDGINIQGGKFPK